MKYVILNHCSHNKGDNSVLFYLTEAIKLNDENFESISISCSDGSLPFWLNEKNVDATYWPGGKIFKNPNVSYFSNAFRRLKFLFMRKFVYKIFIGNFSKGNYSFCKLIAKNFFGEKLFNSIKTADKVFCTGGHHISNVLEKDCINPQLVSLVIATILGKKTIFWSQSIGPFEGASEQSKKAIGKIFDSCQMLYVRDDLSINCINEVSNSNNFIKAPDSVFLSNKLIDVKNKDNTRKYICCAVYTAGITDEKYLTAYRNAWVKISHAAIELGFDVIFLPMQYKGYGGDERPFLKKIINIVNSKKVTYSDMDESPKDTLELYKNASFIIGHKTHSIIYGLALEVPTIAVAYHEKTRYFMSMYGFEEYVFDDVVNNELAIIKLLSEDTIKSQALTHLYSRHSEKFANQLISNMRESICINSH
ncbi:Polysaccharide pyruvyl transferase [Vibrio cholerae]|nr:putative monosaccharide biosynthesis protein [Vibrio cholerae]GIA54214.1 Polysaccharide pyruvyl transferase [Vibrio cholerae]